MTQANSRYAPIERDEDYLAMLSGISPFREAVVGEVLIMLARIGERLCEYGGAPWPDRRCDCKFTVHKGRAGEESGCAEIRTAYRTIERLAGTRKVLTNNSLRSQLRKVRVVARKAAAEIEALAADPR